MNTKPTVKLKKNKRNNKLTRELILLIFLLTTSIFIISIFISFKYQDKQIADVIETEANYIIEKDLALLENEIDEYLSNVEKVSLDERVRSLNWEVQKPFLEESAKKYVR